MIIVVSRSGSDFSDILSNSGEFFAHEYINPNTVLPHRHPFLSYDGTIFLQVVYNHLGCYKCINIFLVFTIWLVLLLICKQ